MIFLYDVCAAVFLWSLALVYMIWPRARDFLKPVELSVTAMWFGALAGSTISLKAIYDHAVGRGRDEAYSLWHYGRPVSGAITGLMTYVLLWALNPNHSPPLVVTCAAAFVLALRSDEVTIGAKQGSTRDRATDVQPMRPHGFPYNVNA